MNELTPSPALACANCGTGLQGEFCYHCGQSVHSVLRPMSHMLEDAGDIFFHMDERIVHTVPPLFTRPGFLTLEYFSGRRVRYIAPFRLMFVFCLMAFFFIHVGVNGMRDGFEAATAGFKNDPATFQHTPIKVTVTWLPAAASQRLERSLEHVVATLMAAASPGPQQKDAIRSIIEGFFAVLPQTMFVMVPIFALVLKVFYLFRRRLYMEHIIVALHSHAFIFLSLLLLVLLSFGRTAVAPHVPFLAGVGRWIAAALWLWIPIYLLVMQKRIYRQGWPMTVLKFACIGVVYFWLLSAALFTAAVVGLNH